MTPNQFLAREYILSMPLGADFIAWAESLGMSPDEVDLVAEQIQDSVITVRWGPAAE